MNTFHVDAAFLMYLIRCKLEIGVYITSQGHI